MDLYVTLFWAAHYNGRSLLPQGRSLAHNYTVYTARSVQFIVPYINVTWVPGPAPWQGLQLQQRTAVQAATYILYGYTRWPVVMKSCMKVEPSWTTERTLRPWTPTKNWFGPIRDPDPGNTYFFKVLDLFFIKMI